MIYLRIIILSLILFYNNTYTQTPPSDFKLIGTTGGTVPWVPLETITILVDGQVKYFRFKGDPPQILLDTNFTITSSQVQQIWQSVQNNNFFSLNSNYRDDTVYDGSVAIFTITADGTTKQVKLRNIIQQQIQEIITAINSNVPASYNLNYTPSEKINIVPAEICDQPIDFSPDLLKEIFPNKYKEENPLYRYIPTADEIQIPHGGAVIGYEMSLFDAVFYGLASLRSKGEFYGDGVSITGNHPLNYSDNRLSIKLYLEFYGPCDNAENVTSIVTDILNKWDGHTTSNGKTIQMDVIVRSNPGETSPPGTPGFNNIKLECGVGTSVAEFGAPNIDETFGGKWYVEDVAGVYAHEVGHLIGLDDQYDGYIKQPDGSWTNELDETTSYNQSDFLNLFISQYPDLTLSDAQKFLNENQRVTWPKPGHKDDLMADFTKPPLQSDIDLLAAQAGLIININAGDIFIDPFNLEQNLIVTHSGDLFLKPGQLKTLNGIYTACIDFYRGIPDSTDLFYIAPPLDRWDGIPAAKDLLKLVNYIDSVDYFCKTYFESQEAIWRITDNSNFGTGDVDSLFREAGININNQIFNFPRLRNNSGADTISKAIVPNELFFPDIQPKIILAEIGENLTYNAVISKPSGFNYTTDFSWLLNTPVNSLTQISADGSFIPDKKGIYTISLNVNITDSVKNVIEYKPELKAYAVIPDRFTETFEHPNLSYRFDWETYGDSKWEITNIEAQTGPYSVKSGEVFGGQSTTLAINVNLQQDSSIAFAMKMFTYNSGGLFFDIDSNFAGYWTSSSDWEFFEYELEAGEHRLTWRFINYYDTPSTVWLDNIFFPTNSVTTGVTQEENIPLTFNLFQNYPNPFNPSTVISWQLPTTSHVSLKVYDILGREVTTLINESRDAGYSESTFDGSSLASGVYIYRLYASGGAGEYNSTRKMLIIK